MSVLLDLSQLRYVSLPGSYPDKQFLPYYQTAYNCWRGVWEAAYKELKIDLCLYSDDFTRQTEINTIFYKQQCIGMLLMQWADFDIGDYRNDSYFKKWGDEDIQKLTQFGKKIIILSYTTISPLWRQDQCHISMKDLISYISARRFAESEADAMTAYNRRLKGIHKLAYRYGAVAIREDVPNFDDNDRVDITALYKNTVSEGDKPEIIELGRKLWKERLVVPREIVKIPASTNEIKIKSAA